MRTTNFHALSRHNTGHASWLRIKRLQVRVLPAAPRPDSITGHQGRPLNSNIGGRTLRSTVVRDASPTSPRLSKFTSFPLRRSAANCLCESREIRTSVAVAESDSGPAAMAKPGQGEFISGGGLTGGEIPVAVSAAYAGGLRFTNCPSTSRFPAPYQFGVRARRGAGRALPPSHNPSPVRLHLSGGAA